jgi:hypothetical protein
VSASAPAKDHSVGTPPVELIAPAPAHPPSPSASTSPDVLDVLAVASTAPFTSTATTPPSPSSSAYSSSLSSLSSSLSSTTGAADVGVAMDTLELRELEGGSVASELDADNDDVVKDFDADEAACARSEVCPRSVEVVCADTFPIELAAEVPGALAAARRVLSKLSDDSSDDEDEDKNCTVQMQVPVGVELCLDASGAGSAQNKGNMLAESSCGSIASKWSIPRIEYTPLSTSEDEAGI